MVFAPLAKASPANRKRISWEMSKVVFARSGAISEYVLCFLYRYSFVKFDVSLSSALWTNTIRFVGHKLITGLSELRWTSPESIYEEILGRVCGLKKISAFWGKFFSCLPKKTQCKSQNCSLRARKENLRAIFGKNFFLVQVLRTNNSVGCCEELFGILLVTAFLVSGEKIGGNSSFRIYFFRPL